MLSFLLVPLLKLLIEFSRNTNLGAGSTWPGHIMLTLNPSFLRQFDKQFKGKIIVVAGTNGKTTTSKMIRAILEKDGKKVIHNESGANLLNGIASSILLHSTILGVSNYEFAIFEVDENTLPLLLEELTPDVLVLLNLFRDQLDRYGEVDTIAIKWKKALEQLPKTIYSILNADDPHIAFLGKEIQTKTRYFGIENKKLYLATRPHAMDAAHCPNCGSRLTFGGIYFAHLGLWRCNTCGLSRPTPDFSNEQETLPGMYNLYNTQATILVAKTLGIKKDVIEKGLKYFSPAFGRQEKFVVDGKKVKIFLSKNPTGFNESIRTIKELGAKHVLIVLNDRIPDGRDVSWIWDVDTEEIVKDGMSVIVSGERAYDMGLRLKYSISSEFQIEEDLKKAISLALEGLAKSETLYILPTYSAMLEVRKILTGRKIL